MDGLELLLPKIHPVDREVLRVSAHPRFTDAARRVLYGYRYWPRVTAAVLANPGQESAFVDRVITIAEAATRTARVDVDLLIGITASAIELYDRVGAPTFTAMQGDVNLPPAAMLETPTMVRRRRARNSPDGLIGALPGVPRRWSLTREPDPDDTYVVREGEPLAPCRGGTHDECLVGIVAGADRLSPVDGHEPYPLVRRACEARVFGRVSVLYLPPLRAASSRSI